MISILRQTLQSRSLPVPDGKGSGHQPGAPPTVSVVVPTKNSERHIRKCLESIRAQTRPPAEVIVCDNGSTDETLRIARELGTTSMQAGPERSAQRNAAARKAVGDALLFIDSDMELSPGVIQSCVDVWHQGARIVTIPEVVVGTGFWARGRNLDKNLCRGMPGYEAARFISRALFLRVGGYDERLIAGEDHDLHLSLIEAGAVQGAAQAPIQHHEDEMRLQEYVKKWRYYASTLDALMEKRGKTRAGMPAFPRVVLSRWHTVIRDPLGFLSLAVLKCVEFAIIGYRTRIPGWPPPRVGQLGTLSARSRRLKGD